MKVYTYLKLNVWRFIWNVVGRSPTGECIGWHNLSEEEYQKKLEEYEKNKSEKE